MRSILFLPTDKIERLPKAIGSGADKVIFDLEDGLAHENKGIGRSNFADLANRNYDGQADKLLLRINALDTDCLLYTSPSPRDATLSRMPSSA